MLIVLNFSNLDNTCWRYWLIEQWADLAGDVFKVSTLIEPVLMEDNEDSMLYREVMRTGITV